MSIRSEIKEIVPHFEHDPEYLAERSRFRGLMRTLQYAEDRLKGKPRKRRKPSGNTGSSANEGQGESESN